MKIAIIAHGHPELNAGGAERAAYSLHQSLKKVSGIDSVLVARAEPSQIGHDGWFGAFRGRRDEYLWAPPPFDWFRRVSQAPDVLRLQIKSLVEHIRPDVVHFHHYFFFGLDAVSAFKEAAACRTVLTLHEYAMICHHDGQMVKTDSLRLCHAASPAECSACFPDITSGKFFLRERLIKQLLEDVDACVSPSEFLKERYVAWGVPARKIETIENLLPDGFGKSAKKAAGAPRRKQSEKRIRFGFFGQINRYKGASVLLDALDYLSEETLERVEVILFGAKLEQQSAEFQKKIKEELGETKAKVSFFGPYRNEDAASLMQGVDWMVVPSVWWENSPLVIQEARALGTPILASNIGGMAEKVREGIDGVHFLAGSAMDLASKIEDVVAGAIELEPQITDVQAHNGAGLKAHMRLYTKLLSEVDELGPKSAAAAS